MFLKLCIIYNVYCIRKHNIFTGTNFYLCGHKSTLFNFHILSYTYVIHCYAIIIIIYTFAWLMIVNSRQEVLWNNKIIALTSCNMFPVIGFHYSVQDILYCFYYVYSTMVTVFLWSKLWLKNISYFWQYQKKTSNFIALHILVNMLMLIHLHYINDDHSNQ